MPLKRFDLVAEFEAGDNIPEWLLYIVPTGDDSSKGNFRFMQPVAVLESAMGFHIVPLYHGKDSVELTGADRVAVGAATKDVALHAGGTHFGFSGHTNAS